mgnify:CR=1 FL=1
MLSKGGRALLQGHGEELNTLETEGQMLQRVMPELMGMAQLMQGNGFNVEFGKFRRRSIEVPGHIRIISEIDLAHIPDLG